MLRVASKIIQYNIFKKTGHPKTTPIILTLSVNDWCNSHCKTCNIWMNNPQLKAAEQLKVDEYDKIMDNFDYVYWVTITGGEPFLREDLPDIVKVVYDHSKPSLMTIATNASLTSRTVDSVKKILDICPNLKLVINISIDGIGDQHDDIRGFKGNYDLAMKTFKELKNINSTRLFVGFNTVISSYNVGSFQNIFEQIQNLEPDSYICEVAENRAKLYNLNLNITPGDNEYQKALKFLIMSLSKQKKKDAPEVVRKLRIQFYKYLMSNKKISNFEGIGSAYIMSNGEVWLSYSKRLVAGNIRDANYDFKKLWFGDKASEYRKLMNGAYSTSAVNAFYTNFICNPKNILKLIFS